MTWSLKLSADGDLALGGKGLDTVVNEKKMAQDLRCELLEERGTNRFNPDFGSLLESDLLAELKTTSVSTAFNREEMMVQIESHIGDVINKYQRRQLARAKADKMARGKATLTPAEVVIGYEVAEIVQNETSINVVVHITTASSDPSIYPITLTV